MTKQWFEDPVPMKLEFTTKRVVAFILVIAFVAGAMFYFYKPASKEKKRERLEARWKYEVLREGIPFVELKVKQSLDSIERTDSVFYDKLLNE